MNEKYLTVRSGVLIPLLQSLVAGLLYGVGTSFVAKVMNDFGFDEVAWWKIGLATFFLAFTRAWLALIDEWRQFLYPKPKKDPVYIESEPVHTKLEISENNGRSMQFIDLPAEPDQLIQLGMGIMEGLSFTEAQWVGRGQPFTRTQFVRLRSELIKRGLLVWNSDLDPARGVKVTGKGRAVMRHFASMTNSPTLRIENTRKPR